MSNSETWAPDAVFLMQIPGFGVIFSMIVLSAIGEIKRFPSAKSLARYAGLGAGVHISENKYQEKSITKKGRKELRWATLAPALQVQVGSKPPPEGHCTVPVSFGRTMWGAVRSDPYWKAQYESLKKRGKHSNEAIVATPALVAQAQVSLAS